MAWLAGETDPGGHRVYGRVGQQVRRALRDDQEAGRNTAVTVESRHFGNHIPSAHLGRSQYRDPYLHTVVDDFRIYGRALTAAEIATLARPADQPPDTAT
ncbi:LamG-like jellyroll fold domain-containing protein [Streptomyces violascens]|uniref:LamG-like jellyroll fold domain-containing protein n=1 Tax=Streptomyces violascens TaxID=67381 RepID=UPI003788012C